MRQEQVKEHFARQADEYEKLMVKLIPQYLNNIKLFTACFPTTIRINEVLDLGCGNGILSELVFQKLPNSHIVGFDLTESMLKAFLRKNCQSILGDLS